jgi:hypothetical protein
MIAAVISDRVKRDLLPGSHLVDVITKNLRTLVRSKNMENMYTGIFFCFIYMNTHKSEN